MMRQESDASRPVLPWRLVVGALLHFVVPVYFLTLFSAWLIDGAPTHGLLGEVLRVSGRFLVGYTLLTLTAALLAAALNPVLTRRRALRVATDPALGQRRSSTRIAEATARAARLAGGTEDRLATAIVGLRRGAWDHADERDQKLSADLAEAVDAFARAHASAGVKGKQEVATLAAASLTRIAAALDDLADERRRLDRGDAMTHARYLDRKYEGGAGGSPDRTQRLFDRVQDVQVPPPQRGGGAA